MKFKTYLNCLVFIGILSSCKEDKLKVDVSGIKVNVPLYRFEQELFTKDMDSIEQFNEYFIKKYGLFYPRFMTGILQLGETNEPAFANNLNHFTSDRDIRQVYDDVSKKYNNVTAMEADLENAFRHYKYYFPEKLIPAAATYISGFNYALMATDSVLGIGLDMYLGKDYEYYAMMGMPKYKTNNMNDYNIVPDAIKGWVISETTFDLTDKNMLEQILYQGKILYIMDALMPNTHDSLKINYTAEQLKWCNENKQMIWAHFIDKKLLYENNPKEISKYLNEGPFTPGLPRESPSKIGVWVGWQIARAYMSRQEKIDLEKLLKTDAQTVLKQSKYKP